MQALKLNPNGTGGEAVGHGSTTRQQLSLERSGNELAANAPPSVPLIAAQTINEDGTLSLAINITDDVTPATGVTVIAQAVRVDNFAVEDLSIVNAPTIATVNSAGSRILTVAPRPNASGQVAIKVRAIDAGGLVTERVFLLAIAPVADAPAVTLAQVVAPQSPLTLPTLDSGSLAVSVQAALLDRDGSETLEVRIANVPAGITFNAGSNVGNGVWVFTPAQLPGLRVQGPATWSQDLALSVSAVSRETATGQTATSAPVALNIPINARPLDITVNRAPAIDENAAPGTEIARFGAIDADAGDTATFTLLANPGNLFSLSSAGRLVATQPLNAEAGASYAIGVRVTDSGGLTRDEAFTVAVNNLPEAPTAIRADRTLRFSESGAGVGLAFFSGDDPENNIAGLSLIDNAGGRFQLSPNGLLSTAGAGLDFEAATFNSSTGTFGYAITVRATDSTGLFFDQPFFVSVDNVNEAPSLNPAAFTVFEGSGAGPGSFLVTTGGAVAQVTGSDPEGVALSYELVGGDVNVFSIDPSGSLRQQGVLDFETRQSYSVTARAWDGGAIGAGNAVDLFVPINVANVNEGPTITAFTSSAVRNLGFPLSANIVHLGFQAVDPEGDALASAQVVSGTLLGPEGVFVGDSPITATLDSLYLSLRPASLDGRQYTIRLTDVNGAVSDSIVQVLGTPPRAVVLPARPGSLSGSGALLDDRLVADAASIDAVERSAIDPVPQSLRPNRRSSSELDFPSQGVQARIEGTTEEPAEALPAPSGTDASSGWQRAATPRRLRLADFDPGSEQAGDPTLQAALPAARGAWHAPLESVTRRRLHMIDAIAGFSAEGAANLSLQPQRRVDARTLELLTSVPTSRVA